MILKCFCVSFYLVKFFCFCLDNALVCTVHANENDNFSSNRCTIIRVWSNMTSANLKVLRAPFLFVTKTPVLLKPSNIVCKQCETPSLSYLTSYLNVCKVQHFTGKHKLVVYIYRFCSLY